MALEVICDDPYGSAYCRALDTMLANTIDTIQPRRLDLTLNNSNLDYNIILNRITGQERTLHSAQFVYTLNDSVAYMESKYAKSR